ncbi:MAG: VgrG-related protein [Cyanobacteria bacterium SBLK]|nr:VgrG-related protein [Cyanobacteria bacterium SBLK]
MVATNSSLSNSSQSNSGNYQSLPKVEIEGQEKQKLYGDLLQVVVEESLHFPAMFTLVIRNDYQPGTGGGQEKPWQHDYLEIGRKIKIGFSASTTASQDFQDENEGQVIEGEITAIEAHFSDQTQAPIVVRGYDVSHRLHRGKWNRSFQNLTDSDLVKKIAGEVGISVGKVDESGIPHEYLFQGNQTNMEFLRSRASRIGFELFIQDGKLNFRKPTKDETLDLEWLRDISNFRVRTTSAEQVKSVEVRGWDYTQKQAIVSTANSEKVVTETQQGKGSETSGKFQGLPAPTLYVVDRPVEQPKEADLMAQALCNEVGGQFVLADARGEGNPKIRPGRVVKLQGMGQYSGQYYVTETRHAFQERIYTTEFSVRGLRGGNLLTLLNSPNRLQPGQTFLVGIVTDNEDPEGLGRIKVKFPSLTEEHSSNWARVVSPGAGKERGFDCLPEIEDEVLVGFEHGDIHRPYVLGGVWNGEDMPPEKVEDSVTDGKVRLRTLRTRKGHLLQFVEEDKSGTQAGVRIKTEKGHQVYLNDSQGKIEIVTKGGHKLILDDNGSKMSMSSTGTLSIEAKGAIDLKTQGVINLSGSQINLG